MRPDGFGSWKGIPSANYYILLSTYKYLYYAIWFNSKYSVRYIYTRSSYYSNCHGELPVHCFDFSGGGTCPIISFPSLSLSPLTCSWLVTDTKFNVFAAPNLCVQYWYIWCLYNSADNRVASLFPHPASHQGPYRAAGGGRGWGAYRISVLSSLCSLQRDRRGSRVKITFYTTNTHNSTGIAILY